MNDVAQDIQAARNLEWLFLAIAAVALAFGRSWVDPWPFVAVLASAAAVNIFYQLFPLSRLRGSVLTSFHVVQVLAYLSLAALLTGFSGGIRSPLYAGLFLVLMVPAINSPALVAAALSLFALGSFALTSALLASPWNAPTAVAFILLALLLAFPVALNLLLADNRQRLRASETFGTLYRISQSLGESLDLHQLLHRLLLEVDGVFQTDISSVRLLDPGTNTLSVEASGAGAVEIVEEQIEIKLGEGFIGWVAKTGESILINDISKDPRFASFPRARKKVASAVATPIKIGERTVGVISCASSRMRRFGEGDLELLNSVASLAGAAIERAELYQQLLSRGEAIVEGMVDGLIVVDRERRTVLTNRTLRELLEIRPSVGEPLDELLKGRVLGWRSFCESVSSKILLSPEEAPESFTTELRLENGTAVLNAKASPITSQWNKVIGAAILLENVTEVVRLTGELAEEKRKLEVVLESVLAGVIAINQKGEVLLANAAAFNMLDIERPSWWLGAKLEKVFPEPEVTRTIWQALASGTEVLDKTLTLDTGRYLEVSCVPIVDPGGGRGGVVAVLYDVSEVHQLEHAKSDFVSMVSHELRTPLTSIKAYVDTLRREDVEFDLETTDGFMEIISRESERMARLINDLLDLSKMEAGHLELKPSFIDLPVIIRKAAESVELPSEEHRIVLNLPEGLEPAVGEAAKIEQVMLNIIGNAMKYSPEGGDVTITLRKLGDRALVTVADRGIGIPAEQLPYVFDKYHRVGRGTTIGVRGSGLGLYVTKTIVEAHGGRIWAESEEGKGTKVMFTMPLVGQESESDVFFKTGESDG